MLADHKQTEHTTRPPWPPNYFIGAYNGYDANDTLRNVRTFNIKKLVFGYKSLALFTLVKSSVTDL